VTKRFERTLPVELSTTELDERRDKLANFDLKVQSLMEELEAVIEEAKAQKKALSTRIDAAQAMCFSLAGEIKDRSAYKAVLCELSLYHDEGQAVTVRTDTGEIIDVRELDEEELQLGLEDKPQKMPAAFKKALKKWAAEQEQEGQKVSITFDDE